VTGDQDPVFGAPLASSAASLRLLSVFRIPALMESTRFVRSKKLDHLGSADLRFYNAKRMIHEGSVGLRRKDGTTR
jgi:hypothetical protein